MDDLFLRLSLKCRSWYCTFSWNLLFSPLDFILSLLPLSLLKYFSPLLFSLQSLSFEEQCFCSSWVSLPYFLLKYQSPLVSSYLTSFLCLALKILKENDIMNLWIWIFNYLSKIQSERVFSFLCFSLSWLLCWSQLVLVEFIFWLVSLKNGLVKANQNNIDRLEVD